MKKPVIGIALMLALSACAGGGSISQLSSSPARIDSHATAQVTVTASVPGADKIAVDLQNEIATQIISKRVFLDVKTGSDPADIRIEAVITEANDVTQAARIMVGALAGRASVTADVKIFDGKTGEALGEIKAMGRSSGGNIFAGTTREAVHETATQITDYLLRNRQI
jgi:Domain of unknown function (DUF4410)